MPGPIDAWLRVAPPTEAPAAAEAPEVPGLVVVGLSRYEVPAWAPWDCCGDEAAAFAAAGSSSLEPEALGEKSLSGAL